jgi:hypothetical protein
MKPKDVAVAPASQDPPPLARSRYTLQARRARDRQGLLPLDPLFEIARNLAAGRLSAKNLIRFLSAFSVVG